MATHGQLAPPGPNDYAPGELLIKFKATATDAQVLHASQRAGLKLRKHIQFKNRNHPGVAHVSTPLDVAQALRILEKHPAIEYVEPNYRLYPAATPNDPQFSTQWGLHNTGQRIQGVRGTADADMDAPEAWNITTGSSSVLIGVIDTGIDIYHPDLAANIWTNPDEIPNDGIDNDGNGYVDDVHGWDWWNGDNTVYDPADGDVHGTRVAGVIAAVGNNGIGITGVNWQARILPLKIKGPDAGFVSSAILAIEYATAKGAKVLNASWGPTWVLGADSQALKDAIEASDAVFVAVAGNNSSDNDATPFYPSSFDSPNLIAVAATDYLDRLASFSNYGATSVHLGAPGVNILCVLPGNQYGYSSGTSLAGPHVSGVAGLIYARFPNLTAVQVKEQILASVDPISALSGKTVTGGRLNAARALVLIDHLPSVAITSPPDGAVVAGTISISATAWDDHGVAWVAFYLDGVLLGSDSEAPYQLSNWDSTSVAEGPHTITALAADTANQTASHTVTVVVDNLNDPPVANAGADQTITDADNSGTETVTLNGSASFDPDGSIVAYEWKEGATILGNTATLNVNVPVGVWTFTLTVMDNEGATSSDTVQVTVDPFVSSLEVFNDSFERAALTPWTQDGQNDWFTSTQRATAGSRSAEVDGAAANAQLISPLINLQGRTAATITFSWLIESGLDTGDYIACDVSTNGGSTWTEVRRLRGDVDAENIWHAVTVEVSSAPAGTVRLRFRGNMDKSDEDANVDNVRVVAR